MNILSPDEIHNLMEHSRVSLYDEAYKILARLGGRKFSFIFRRDGDHFLSQNDIYIDDILVVKGLRTAGEKFEFDDASTLVSMAMMGDDFADFLFHYVFENNDRDPADISGILDLASWIWLERYYNRMDAVDGHGNVVDSYFPYDLGA